MVAGRRHNSHRADFSESRSQRAQARRVDPVVVGDQNIWHFRRPVMRVRRSVTRANHYPLAYFDSPQWRHRRVGIRHHIDFNAKVFPHLGHRHQPTSALVDIRKSDQTIATTVKRTGMCKRCAATPPSSKAGIKPSSARINRFRHTRYLRQAAS